MAKEKKFVQAITSRDMQSGRRSRQTLTRDLKRQVLKTYICQC